VQLRAVVLATGMKRLFLLCCSVMTLAAHADLVIVQKIEGAGQNGEVTMKIKGGKSRSDITPQITTLMDTNTGEMTTVMHAQKSYMKIPASTTKAVMAKMQEIQQQQGAANAAPPKLQPTGKKEKIGEYEAEQFTANVGNIKATYWIAKDFPNYAALLQQMRQLENGMGNVMKNVAPSPSEFPGMPVKTEIEMGPQKIVTTLISVKDEPVAESEFEVPAGYTEMTAPQFNLPSGQPAPAR
jgi:hypothetical protein